MPNKWLLITGGLAVIAWWLIHSYTNPDKGASELDSNHNSTIELTESKVSEKTIDADDQVLSTATNQPNKLTADQLIIWNEIEQRIYSEDPYVELTSLEIQLGLCREEFEAIDLFTAYGTVYQQQQQLHESLNKECASYRNQYPNVLSMNDRKVRESFKPTSQLGRLLKAQTSRNLTPIERHENNQLRLLYALKEKNASLVLISSFEYRFNRQNRDLMRTLLGSNDTEYSGKISQLALTLMSCDYQGGQSCTNTSMIMVMTCSQNPESCGLDYPTWYQQNTLPGMKRDVEKLLTYFQQMSQ